MWGKERLGDGLLVHRWIPGASWPQSDTSLLFLVPGLDREREESHRSGWSLASAPPPCLLPCIVFYLISQPCCHGTEDGNSTLVLNDLLDDSLLVRHSCPVLLKCTTERNELLVLLLLEGRGGDGGLFDHFVLSLTASERGIMGYLPNKLLCFFLLSCWTNRWKIKKSLFVFI